MAFQEINSDIDIRPLELKDIDRVKLIEERCGLEFWSVESYRREIDRPDSICLVASFEVHKIIGFITARLIMSNHPNPSDIPDRTGTETYAEAEIYNFGTDRDFRHVHTGALLFRQLLDELRQNEVAGVFLEVRESNRRAQGFYRKYGFETVGRRRNFYRNPTEDAFTMRLELRDMYT